MATSDVATGITIGCGTSNFAAQITNIDGPELIREWLRNTHQGTALAHTGTVSDLYDPGSLEIEGWFDADITPPVQSETAVEVITITWPSGAMWVFSAGWTRYRSTATLEETMTFSATLNITGAIDISPAAGGTTTAAATT